MKKFDQFIKESIRDKMSGPDIDPRKILKDDTTTANQKLSIIGENSLVDFFSDEEIKELKYKAAKELIADAELLANDGEYEELISFVSMSLDHKTIMDIISDNGRNIMELLYLYFYDEQRKYLMKYKDDVVKKLIDAMKENVDRLAENISEMYNL